MVMKAKGWKWNLIVAIIIISSVIVVFVNALLPLTATQIWYIWIFDLMSMFNIFIDYMNRLLSSDNKSRFILKHWYEIPAMMPLIVIGTPSFRIIRNSALDQVHCFISVFYTPVQLLYRRILNMPISTS